MVSDPSPVRTAGAEPETETESEIEAIDASPEDSYACPLCGFSRETRDAVYSHLVVSHRKRAISSALLETQTNEAE